MQFKKIVDIQKLSCGKCDIINFNHGRYIAIYKIYEYSRNM